MQLRNVNGQISKLWNCKIFDRVTQTTSIIGLKVWNKQQFAFLEFIFLTLTTPTVFFFTISEPDNPEIGFGNSLILWKGRSGYYYTSFFAPNLTGLSRGAFLHPSSSSSSSFVFIYLLYLVHTHFLPSSSSISSFFSPYFLAFFSLPALSMWLKSCLSVFLLKEARFIDYPSSVTLFSPPQGVSFSKLSNSTHYAIAIQTRERKREETCSSILTLSSWLDGRRRSSIAWIARRRRRRRRIRRMSSATPPTTRRQIDRQSGAIYREAMTKKGTGASPVCAHVCTYVRTYTHPGKREKKAKASAAEAGRNKCPTNILIFFLQI